MKIRYLFNLFILQIFHSNSDGERHEKCKGSITEYDFLGEVLINLGSKFWRVVK